MKNTRMAEGYLGEAMSKIKIAEFAVGNGMYASAFRLAQEAVELGLKGALRLVGVEYPREHDVSIVLAKEAERFPDAFRRKIPKLQETSAWLARHRGPALYGDEESGIPPGELFSKKASQEAFRRAADVLKSVEGLLQRY